MEASRFLGCEKTPFFTCVLTGQTQGTLDRQAIDFR
jgi:hypothetical protein